MTATAALGLIDQTIYANADSDGSLVWRNDEVLQMLRDIRHELIANPASPDSSITTTGEQ